MEAALLCSLQKERERINREKSFSHYWPQASSPDLHEGC
jgi:hypothetical protein